MKSISQRFLVVTLAFLFVSRNAIPGGLNIVAEFPVPIFNSNVPTSFTDICFDTGTEKLALCSDGGYGEFPVNNGKVQFAPPGFIAATGNFIIRGYTNTPAGLSAADNRGRFIFWGKSGRIPLPVDVGNISEMAWDGTRLWIARQLPARLFAFLLKNGNKLILVQTVDFSFPVLQSVTFHNQTLWVTDGIHIFRLNTHQQIVSSWKVPAPISGFCFVNHTIFATSLTGHKIYRISNPE